MFLAILAVACGGQESEPAVGATSFPTDIPSTPPKTIIPEPTAEPPIASFTVDIVTGTVPLIVNFNSTSHGPITSMEWDFGDGTTSSDQSPSHRYTVAGVFDVGLTATGPSGSDTNVLTALIAVKPGPPASLEISPKSLTLAVQAVVTFVGIARDEFGNETPATYEWSIDEATGVLDENGLFTAGTNSGEFTDAIMVSLQDASGRLVSKASIIVEPGPVARVEIEPSGVNLDIGATEPLTYKAFDSFDNEIPGAIATWTVPPDVGAIDADGLFTGGTKAGTFLSAIRLELVDRTASSSASVDVIILPGPLATVEVQPSSPVIEWGSVQQFEATGIDQFGNEVPDLAYTWEAEGGEINDTGLFTATGSGARHEITATGKSSSEIATGLALVAIPPLFTDIISAPDLEIVVTNSEDVINGNVSSPSALKANPGPDGISLREAVDAVNNGLGPLTITFSDALTGATIKLSEGLFVIHNQVTIIGPRDRDGNPEITIDAKRGGFIVRGSDFTLIGLRIINIGGRGGFSGVFINPSEDTYDQPGPALITNIRIEGNVFIGGGSNSGSGVRLDHEGASGAIIRDVTIMGNTFSQFLGDVTTVHLRQAGTGSVIENVVISSNKFSESTYPIELSASFTNNRTSNTWILRNTFENNFQPVSIGAIGEPDRAASGNVFSQTLISQNVFLDNQNPAVIFSVGVNATAVDNVALDTQIVGNLITRSGRFAVISIAGGRDGARNNRVEGVRIVNNTIADNPTLGGAIAIKPNLGGFDNFITGVTVVNTIFWGNFGGDFDGLSPDKVQYSITSQQGFAGVNGNIPTDPRFVNSVQGDFHLLAVSPAIDAGTSEGAPLRDLEFHERFDDPATPNTGAGALGYYDIGVYEFQSPSAEAN